MENNMMSLQVIDEREVLGKEFRIYGTVDEPLFLAKDVAELIEYNTNSISKLLSMVDEAEKIKTRMCKNNLLVTQGVNIDKEMWFLTEDGLYELLMRSRVPIAKEFKKKVKAILKQIRQTGGYIPIQQEDSEAEILSKALLIAQKTMEKKDLLLAQKEQQLLEQQPKVIYHDAVLNADKLISTTLIAKEFGTTAQKLHDWLHEAGIIYKKSKTWVLYKE